LLSEHLAVEEGVVEEEEEEDVVNRLKKMAALSKEKSHFRWEGKDCLRLSMIWKQMKKKWAW
jgi:hypothetical protein